MQSFHFGARVNGRRVEHKKKLKNSREKKSFKLKRIIIIVKFSLGIIVGYIEDCVMRIFFRLR